MPFGRRFRRLLSLPVRTDAAINRDVDDEMAFHLEMRAAELQRAGIPADEAARRARAEYGDVDRARRALSLEDQRVSQGARRTLFFDELRQDIKYATRQLVQHRAFTAIAVTTLALGIGANTAIFSAVHGIVLQPLPFERPQELLRITSLSKDKKRMAMSVPDYLDFRTQARTFSGIAAYDESTANLTGDGVPERLQVGRVTDNLFAILGAHALRGRLFAPGEDLRQAPRVGVISEALWRDRFGADEQVVGRRVILDGEPTEIIGVLPRQYSFPEGNQIWLTTRWTADEMAPNSRGARYLGAVARLAPAATVDAAAAELHAISQRIAESDPKHNTGYGATAIPLRDALVGSIKGPLFLILGAVGLVMLISCVNVAGLLLGRTSSREGEMAVRAALGAGRGRIVRQLLTESLMLSFVGAAFGLALGAAGLRVLIRLAPADTPRLSAVHLNGTMLAFTAGLALVTGVLFGLIPALHASTTQLYDKLKSGGRGMSGGGGRTRARQLLVTSEIAFAIVLVVGAGLLLRSFTLLRDVDPGFQTSRRVAFTVSLAGDRYASLEGQRQFAADVRERLRRIPGVDMASSTFGLPLTGTRFQLSFSIDGRPAPAPNDEPRAQIRIASSDFFRTLGIPLLRGRSFAASDRKDAPPVLVVTQEFVRRYFPNEDPLGKRLRMGWERDGHELGGEIIGVVGDVKQFDLASEAVPSLYASSEQWPLEVVTFIVTSSLPADALARPIREALHEVDANLPIFAYQAMDAVVAAALSQPRFYLTLVGAFAASALVLAAIGLYGVIAYGVQQRTREIGVRMALGASSRQMQRMVVREGLALSAVGAICGLAGAWALGRYLQSLLFGVKSADPLTFSAAAVMIVIVALIACLVPARRAASIDPQRALRAD
jgi:predicted permease